MVLWKIILRLFCSAQNFVLEYYIFKVVSLFALEIKKLIAKYQKIPCEIYGKSKMIKTRIKLKIKRLFTLHPFFFRTKFETSGDIGKKKIKNKLVK